MPMAAAVEAAVWAVERVAVVVEVPFKYVIEPIAEGKPPETHTGSFAPLLLTKSTLSLPSCLTLKFCPL